MFVAVAAGLTSAWPSAFHTPPHTHTHYPHRFHSLYEIIKQISPVVSPEGIEVIETAAFKLHCFQTRTGVKLVVTATPDTRSDELLTLCQYVYMLYSDYALKSPFYEIEQPINCHLFATEVNRAVQTKVYLQQQFNVHSQR